MNMMPWNSCQVTSKRVFGSVFVAAGHAANGFHGAKGSAGGHEACPAVGSAYGHQSPFCG